MKRRDVLQTAATSIIAAFSVNALSAHGENSSDLRLNSIEPGKLPTGDVPILTPENVYTMPRQFWQNFEGTLWIGKKAQIPAREGNQIPVYLRSREGSLAQIEQPITLNRENLEQFISDNAALIADPAHSMAVFDRQGKALFNISDVTKPGKYNFSQRLSSPEGYQLIGELQSIDELRKTRPLFEGAKIKLKSWHAGLEVGGGEFIGSFSGAEDDGGVIFAGEGFHWRRVVDDYNQLNLFDFGAIADGKTDAVHAIKAMYHWTQKNNQQISIQFPAGRFFVSGFDVSEKYTRFFRLTGSPVNFGYFPTTTIVSDGKSDFIFLIKARWVEISNIAFHGHNERRPNRQGFFKNICPAGQFFRAACLRFVQVGGVSLSLMDTLDCKIDQWYATHCTGDVIKGVWSNSKHGAWHHNTAIELSNFNAQHCKKGTVINLPRCGQSFIHNGWIEHSDYPGDISNGQWIIDGLSMEGCKNPLNAQNTRLNMRQINLQVGSSIDNSANKKTAWLSQFEQGSSHVEAYGISTKGSLKYSHLGSPYHLSNDTDKDRWVYLARLFSPEVGDCWEIEIFGQADAAAGSDEGVLMDAVRGRSVGGKAIIQVQRKAKKSEAVWSSQGVSPISEVFYDANYDTDTRVFIKVRAHTKSATVIVKTTARDRFMAGQCALFDAKLNTMNRAPKRGQSAPCHLSLHNGKAGFGANEQGDILFTSREIKAQEVDTENAHGFLSVVINGEPCAIPFYRLRK